MAKVGHPLRALDSRHLGKTLIVQQWKGQYYVRKLPIPRYQRTPNQARVRDVFAAAVHAYQQLDEITRMLWRILAKGTYCSGYEIYLRNYIKTH